jgi:hypothetical protein
MITKKTIEQIIKEEVYRKKAWDIVKKHKKLFEQDAPPSPLTQTAPASDNPKYKTNAEAKAALEQYWQNQKEIEQLYALIKPTLDIIGEKEVGGAQILKGVEAYMRDYNKSTLKTSALIAKITVKESTKKENPKYKELFEKALTYCNDAVQKSLNDMKEAMKKVTIIKDKVFSVEPLVEGKKIDEGIVKDFLNIIKNIYKKLIEYGKLFLNGFKNMTKENDKLNSAAEKYLKSLG